MHGPSIGSKRQITLLFAEGEESLTRKKKCEGLDGFDGSSYEETELSAVAAMQHYRGPRIP